MKNRLAFSLFDGLTQAEQEALISCLGAARRAFARGETLLRAGEPARFIGVVMSGALRAEREDYCGGRSVIGMIGEGELFAETLALSGEEEMPVSVVGAEPGEALLMPAQRMLHPCAQACGFHHRFADNMVRILAQKNLMLTQKAEILSRRTTRDKLMAYLMMEAQRQRTDSFLIPYDRQELADYLGVDRSGLSSEIGKLRREGVLSCVKNRFTLLAGNQGG